MRAAIYKRVSAMKQSIWGTSMQTQDARCRAAAAEADYVVLDHHIFSDIGSGATLDRPGLTELRLAVREQAVDAVWIYDTDRLARDPLDFLTIFREFTEHGVSLKSVRRAINTGPDGDLLAFVDGWVSEQERLSLLRRSKDGKNDSARSGLLRIGNSHGVYGYDYVPETKSRVINPYEAKIVREIFARVIDGDSIYSIASDLHTRGVPTKRGGVWDSATITTILNRTSYFGLDLYGRTRMQIVNGRLKRVKVPEHEWIPVYDYSPAFISQEEFEAAHAARTARNRKRLRERRHPLTEYTRCGACGGRVVGRSNVYYRCGNAVHRGNYPRQCNAGHIRKDVLEPWVWQAVSAAVRNPRTVLPILFPAQMAGSEQIDAEIAAARAAIRKNERDMDALFDLWQSDRLDKAFLREGLAELKAEWEALQQRIREWEDQQSQTADLADRAAQFSALCQEVAARMDSFKPDELPSILSAFGVCIIATRDKAECTISLDSDTAAVVIQ